MKSHESKADIVYKQMAEIFSADSSKKTNLIVEISPPLMNIRFNRPKRYNAFTMDMYATLTQSIKKAQTMQDIKFIVLSGQGGNFSSGNDLTNFTNPLVTQLGDFPDVLKGSSKFLFDVTEAMIKSKKPIIALTEGKVIGFTFTMLALLDKVFAVQNSHFTAPLVSTAQGPELCASYTFPKIFGKSVAEELVTFGKPVNADYLQRFNFVEKCKNREQAEKKLKIYLNTIDELEWQSFINARRLYKERDEKILLQVAEQEIQNLLQRWQNPALFTYIAKHMQKMKRSAKL